MNYDAILNVALKMIHCEFVLSNESIKLDLIEDKLESLIHLVGYNKVSYILPLSIIINLRKKDPIIPINLPIRLRFEDKIIKINVKELETEEIAFECPKGTQILREELGYESNFQVKTIKSQKYTWEEMMQKFYRK